MTFPQPDAPTTLKEAYLRLADAAIKLVRALDDQDPDIGWGHSPGGGYGDCPICNALQEIEEVLSHDVPTT